MCSLTTVGFHAEQDFDRWFSFSMLGYFNASQYAGGGRRIPEKI